MGLIKNISGIYSILCIPTGKMYIGSTDAMYKRFYRHRWELVRKEHHCEKLQYAWNKHGEANFIFKVIEECDKNIRLEREQYWIEYYESYKHGFNCNPKAQNCEGRVVSNKTRIKISEKLKGRKISYVRAPGHYDNCNVGKKKRIYQYSLSGEFIAEYDTVKAASQINQLIKPMTVRNAVDKINRSANGYRWYYEYKGECIGPLLKNRDHSEGTKSKLSISAKGKHHSDETKRKISLSTSKAIKEWWDKRKAI